MNMNMTVSGSGTIPSGEYENVTVRGSAQLHGKVRCTAFVSSGTTKGEQLECLGLLRASGSTSFSGSVRARQINTSGSFSCGGDLRAEQNVSCSGSTACQGGLACENLSASGSIRVGGDIEAETVKVAGAVNCDGLINAESIEIKFDQGMAIGSIGGSRILIKKRRCSLSRLGQVKVTTAIEGDDITLEHVTCPQVTGRTVIIGKGCRIHRVQYSENIQISPQATVETVEKM